MSAPSPRRRRQRRFATSADQRTSRRHRIEPGPLRPTPPLFGTFLALLFGWMALGSAVGLLLPNAVGFLIWMIPLLPMVGIAVYWRLPGSIEIGNDGSFISWMGEKRFVPFRELASCTTFSRPHGKSRYVGVNLRLSSGEVIEVPRCVEGPGAQESVAALDRDIRLATEAFGRRGDPLEADQLTRGDAPPREWLTKLRVVGAGANAGPREAAIPRDRLWSMVEDPSARAATRAAAAAALTATLDPSERQRLLELAFDTASPPLRIALQRAAGDDDDALVEALAAIEAEEDEAAGQAR